MLKLNISTSYPIIVQSNQILSIHSNMAIMKLNSIEQNLIEPNKTNYLNYIPN